MFDIVSYFEDRGVSYSTAGKNVTKNWVNISCPFCGDSSNHMGISLTSSGFNCWACGQKGKQPHALIMQLDSCSYQQAKRIVEEFDNVIEQEEEEKHPVLDVAFPKGIEKIFPAMHREYLEKRGFDPDTVIKKYSLKSCLHIGGDFAYRIIIPIIINDQMVSFTSRDVTGKAKSKYKHLSNEKSIIQVKDCIYNIDTVKDKIIITEGVVDVWRLGNGAVAMFGTEWTTSQLNLLFSKNLKEAYVMLDNDAIKKSNKLAFLLSSFIPKVEVIELDYGDPAELTEIEVRKLRRDISI